MKGKRTEVQESIIQYNYVKYNSILLSLFELIIVSATNMEKVIQLSSLHINVITGMFLGTTIHTTVQ